MMMSCYFLQGCLLFSKDLKVKLNIDILCFLPNTSAIRTTIQIFTNIFTVKTLYVTNRVFGQVLEITNSVLGRC